MRISIAGVFLLAGVPLAQGCSGACPSRPGSVRTGEVSESERWELGLEEGEQTLEICAELCDALGILEPTACVVEGAVGDTADTELTITCEGTFYPMCEGRRPPGLRPLKTRSRLHRAAWMEAASVHAFVRLHRELTQHGAPAELAIRCLSAARDEVEHARMVARIAGVPVPRPEVAPLPLRDLGALALDNAVEGCVHETWAAVDAHLRAARGAHRATWARIAADETRHAQLAWDIDAWLAERGAARPDARRRAAERLVRAVPASRRPLASSLHGRLWA